MYNRIFREDCKRCIHLRKFKKQLDIDFMDNHYCLIMFHERYYKIQFKRSINLYSCKDFEEINHDKNQV